MPIICPLGQAHVSVVPPTALHSIGLDEAWDIMRPHNNMYFSPLLVFVNSKSGDNQGVKFLRRFKQLLNPAQVFDLISTGPGLGLRLFRHFDPFRILVCSGDGSVGWVVSEIDRLGMNVSGWGEWRACYRVYLNYPDSCSFAETMSNCCPTTGNGQRFSTRIGMGPIMRR